MAGKSQNIKISLSEIKDELLFAEEALKDFSNEEFDSKFRKKYWFDFLVHLDLIFIKAERACIDIKNKFEPFQGKYKNQRKNDPMLSYLKNSRDAGMHALEIIAGVTHKRAPEGLLMAIIHVEDDEGKKEQIPAYAAYITTFNLQSFFINKKTWDPPQEHLGEKIESYLNPIIVGNMGLEYYRGFIDDIEVKFKDYL